LRTMGDEIPDEMLFCAVVYNYVGEDVYEKMHVVDPTFLGFKPEYDIHVATIKEEYQAIVEALATEEFHACAINIEDRLASLQHFLIANRPDVVFNLVETFHGQPGLEAAIAGLYELYEISYTGATPFTLALCQRKGLTKHTLVNQGVPTPRYRLIDSPKFSHRHGLHYPLIVKPANEDASTGVGPRSVVHNLDQLKELIGLLFKKFDPPMLIEEYIEGKELHVSVLGNDPPQVLPLLEYDFSNLPKGYPQIITYDVKWNPLEPAYHKVHSKCPADLPPNVTEEVKKQALRAYRAVHCRDYARIDMRLDKNLQPFVLEINPNPDLTEGVSFMESAEEEGLSFSQTLGMIAEFALER